MATQTPFMTESPDLYGAFPRLSDEQVTALETVGEHRRVGPGTVLYREGKDALEAVMVEDTETRERRRIDARALFVFIGADPHTERLRGRVRDARGWQRSGAGPAAARDQHAGVFAAGGVRIGSAQRVAAARQVHQLLGGRLQAVRLAQAYVSSE